MTTCRYDAEDQDYLTPDGGFYRWLGSTNLANDPLVEVLSAADYADTSRLYNAQADNGPAAVTVNPGAVRLFDAETSHAIREA